MKIPDNRGTPNRANQIKTELMKMTKSVLGKPHLEFHLDKALMKSKYVEFLNFFPKGYIPYRTYQNMSKSN